jgi:septal ring factor EnvC (AmiA/AmiB activator)
MTRWSAAFLVLLAMAVGAFGQSRRHAEQRLDSLKAELDAKRTRLDQLGQSEGDLLGKLQELEETIDLNEEVVGRLKKRESRLTGEIVLADSLAAVRESLLVDMQDAYRARLVALSKHRIIRPPDWLFFLADPSQAVLSLPLLRSIGRADRWLISRYDSLRADVEQSRTILIENKAQLRGLRREKQQETDLLTASRKKRNTQLRQIRSERSGLAQAMQELGDAARRLEALIDELVESGAASYGGDGRHIKRAKGRLPWPVRGRVTEGFGYRELGPKRAKVPHNGLTIEARVGTEVTAVADGAVSYTGRLRGYGRIVIIDHGGGYFTLYGHLDEVNCFKGQIVLQGDPVGTVGESGSLSGPQLYFELREQRVQVDPIPWLGP